jgi:hypothetical protein
MRQIGFVSTSRSWTVLSVRVGVVRARNGLRGWPPARTAAGKMSVVSSTGADR